MADLIAIFTTSLMVGFSGAMMPGPLLTVVISESARWGFIQGPLLVLGHAVAELFIVVALSRGLNKLLKRDLVAGLVGLVGGTFLLWMGYSIAESAWRGTLSLSLASGREGGVRLGPIATGILVSVSNPYWLLWWATVGAGYVLFSLKHGPLGLGGFYIGHISSDLSWYSLVAFVVSSGKEILSQSIYRGVLLVCSLFLIALSLYFICSGVRFLCRKSPVTRSLASMQGPLRRKK